jgi:hypothetical protein
MKIEEFGGIGAARNVFEDNSRPLLKLIQIYNKIYSK